MKFKYSYILFVVLVLLSACNTAVEPKGGLGQIYIAALDPIMQQDKALSSNMEYIAIDMSENFEELDKSEKEEVLSYFHKKYKVEVMDASYEQLKEKGLYDLQTLSLDGVLLRIEKIEFISKDEIYFMGSKYRSGLGAVGIELYVHYEDDQWKSKDVRMIWIS